MDWGVDEESARQVGRPGTLGAAVTAMALLDEVDCGLVVCDEAGRVHVHNLAARRELRTARLLQRVGDAVRRVPGVAGELEAAMAQAARHLRHSLVRLRHGDDQLLVSVAPMQLPGLEETQVLLMLGRREACSEAALQMLADAHGLTRAEHRVLGALLRQATPREIAQAHGVALSTVRSQLSTIRGKFGVRTVEALLLRIAQAPPAAA